MSQYRLHELAKASGASPRTIRYYVQHELLPPAHGRGRGSVYGEEHLLCLRAIDKLKAEKLTLGEILDRIQDLQEEGLKELLGAPSGSAPAIAQGATSASATALPGGAAAAERPPSQGGERWDRITLVPGLELHVRLEGGPLVQRLADEIRARYAV